MNVEILGLKGQGYFCIVQKAKDLEINEIVAIKQLKKEFSEHADYIQRFKREVRILKELKDCPYIISCIKEELDDEKKIYRYSMPLAVSNLFHFIRDNNNKLTLEERVHIFDQVLEAIRFAHSKSIIHRDIAPNNVLIFLEGEKVQVKLSDFGLGKDHKSLSRLSKSAGNYGQAYYVAPEQIENLKNATQRSDIYSLGRLLKFVITGRDPITDELGDKFSSLVQKATKFNPEERHNDIEDFIEHYEKAKSLYMGNINPSVNYETMKQYLATINNEVDWAEFHRLSLEAKVIDHVFEDYLEPIVELLSQPGKLSSYLTFAEDGIFDFLNVFSANLRRCLGTIGWPFRYLNEFGRFLYTLYNSLPQPELQLICLKDLWEVSFEQDQWEPEKLMERIIRGGIHPSNIEPFAEYLMDSNCRHASKIIENGRLSEIHPLVRSALQQVVERAEMAYRKRMEDLWSDE